MNHHVRVADPRPSTGDFDEIARQELGTAVIRAREQAGWSQEELRRRAGIGRTSLYKLESGDPVGPKVYEPVARVLPGWTEDTPRKILDGTAAPPEPPSATTSPDQADVHLPDHATQPIRPRIGSDEWLIKFATLLDDERDYLEVRMLWNLYTLALNRIRELEQALTERRVPQP